MAPAKKKTFPTGTSRFNLTLLDETVEWFREKAEKEGVPIQSLMGPVLNAVARGEIKGGYSVEAAPHGNSKQQKQAA